MIYGYLIEGMGEVEAVTTGWLADLGKVVAQRHGQGVMVQIHPHGQAFQPKRLDDFGKPVQVAKGMRLLPPKVAKLSDYQRESLPPGIWVTLANGQRVHVAWLVEEISCASLGFGVMEDEQPDGSAMALSREYYEQFQTWHKGQGDCPPLALKLDFLVAIYQQSYSISRHMLAWLKVHQGWPHDGTPVKDDIALIRAAWACDPKARSGDDGTSASSPQASEVG